MSQGTACTYREHRQRWRVMQYRCNYSAFNGSRYTPSGYSRLVCLEDGRTWRTQAKYVNSLALITATEYRELQELRSRA